MNRFKSSALKYFCSAVMLIAVVTVRAQNFPVPSGNPKQLFYLQRDPNPNTIVCELNYKNGVVDVEEPVHVFWIRYGEQGQRQELNFIQRKFAYGVKITKIANEKYELHFVSYKKYPMYLMKGANNKYNVYGTINQKQAIINRIYVRINGGSMFSPNVEYVEIKGTDPATGKEVVEKRKV